jgi:uncharacterized protein YndB with AHSA1/START domain
MSKLKVLTGAPNEIVMQREFNAPRHLVIKAMTTPELVKRWLGGVRTEVLSAAIDYRVGGSYRYVFRPHGGSEFTFTGTYREISDERVVHSERFNDEANHEAIVTTTMTETGGVTTLHMVIAFASQAVRDMVAGTGMADGAGESYDELEKLLATL